MVARASFGELLRYYRLRAADGRWSQQWLADQLGYHESHISRWENSRRHPPPRPLMLQIGDLLGLSNEQVDTLLEAAGTQSPQPERYPALSAKERNDRSIFYGPSHVPI